MSLTPEDRAHHLEYLVHQWPENNFGFHPTPLFALGDITADEGLLLLLLDRDTKTTIPGLTIAQEKAYALFTPVYDSFENRVEIDLELFTRDDNYRSELYPFLRERLNAVLQEIRKGLSEDNWSELVSLAYPETPESVIFAWAKDLTLPQFVKLYRSLMSLVRYQETITLLEDSLVGFDELEENEVGTFDSSQEVELLTTTEMKRIEHTLSLLETTNAHFAVRLRTLGVLQKRESTVNLMLPEEQILLVYQAFLLLNQPLEDEALMNKVFGKNGDNLTSQEIGLIAANIRELKKDGQMVSAVGATFSSLEQPTLDTFLQQMARADMMITTDVLTKKILDNFCYLFLSLYRYLDLHAAQAGE